MSIAALAVQIGAPILGKILDDKLGRANGALAGEVIQAVAKRAGVPVNQLDTLAETDQPRAIDALREVEKMTPELVALYASGLEFQLAQIKAEAGEPVWARAWRPAGMYMLGLLWLWNTIVLHVCNAIWTIALPPMPYDQLMQISGLYMGLYMGGHTVKDLAEKWKEKT